MSLPPTFYTLETPPGLPTIGRFEKPARPLASEAGSWEASGRSESPVILRLEPVGNL